MPTQLIVNMGQKYPFGKCEDCRNPNTKIMVKKKVITGNKTQNLTKAKFLRNLNPPNTIKIQSIFQQQESICLIYQYVSLKFETWMINISADLIQKVMKDLQQLANILSEQCINTNFCVDRIGFGSNYKAKYFLDLDFKILPKQNSVNLKQKYYREIVLMMKQSTSINLNPLKKQFFFSLKQNSQFKNSLFKNISLDYQQKKILTRTPSLDIIHSFSPNQNQKSLQKSISLFNSIQKKAQTKQSDEHLNLNLTIDQYKRLHSNRHKNRLKTEQTYKNSSNFGSIKTEDKKEELIQFINPIQYFSNGERQKNSIKKKFNPNKAVFSSDRCISIDQQTKKNNFNKTPSKYRSTMDELGSSLIIKKEVIQKSLKSEENSRTPKNSQSPVQYLEIIKSNEEYIQDFLNVLEDSHENKQCCDKQIQKSLKYTLQNEYQNKKINRLKTQQSDQNSQLKSSANVKWKYRINNVLQNSKKLIEKLKSPKRAVETNI